MIAEPQKVNRKSPEESFFDYEGILPQHRFAEANQNIDTPKTPTQKIIDNIFSYSPPKPTYDPNRPEELKRLAKASVIGKGLNLVGDVIGLGLGANVRPRQKDDRELSYLQSMYQYVDEVNRRQDEWNWQDYVNKLKMGDLALSQANLEEERKLREKMFESQEKWKELGFMSEQVWREWQAKKAETDQDLAMKKFEVDIAYKDMTATERERHNKQMEIAGMLRAQAQALRAQYPAESTKTYSLYDSEGNSVSIPDDERGKIIALILEDPLSKITAEEMDLLKAKFGTPLSTNTINTLIQKYWEKTPSSYDYILNKYGDSGQRKPAKEESENDPFDF